MMSASILKKGFFLLSVLLTVWVSSAQAVALPGGVFVQPASVVSIDHHHVAVTAPSMFMADAHLTVAAKHAAGAVCSKACAAGCAAACGHGTAAIGVDATQSSSFDTPAPDRTQYPLTEAFQDALLRPPRLLRLS